MQFERLHVNKDYRGGLSGSIEFSNDLGKIALTLPDELAQKLLAICAETLVDISKQAAEEMSVKVIEAVTPLALPGRSAIGSPAMAPAPNPSSEQKA